jgi:hypothetical protein
MKEIERLKEIKILLKTGKIDYDRAKEMAEVPLSLFHPPFFLNPLDVVWPRPFGLFSFLSQTHLLVTGF